MKKANKILISVSAVLLVVSVLSLVYFINSFKYPNIINHIFTWQIVIVVGIPIIGLIIGFIKIKNDDTVIILYCFVYFAMILSFFHLSFNIFVLQTLLFAIDSETYNADNYMVFDERAEAYIDDEMKYIIPQSIPQEATDVQYEYCYWSGFFTDVRIYASWSLPDELYEDEKLRIIKGTANDVVENNGIDYYVYDSENDLIVWFDDSSNRVFYHYMNGYIYGKYEIPIIYGITD